MNMSTDTRALRNVVIVGAGAMGCLFAARLQEGGATVTLIDNNAERLSLIAKEGLELSDDSGTRSCRPGTALAPEHRGPVDLLMLFTKGMHSAAAVGSIAHLAQYKPIAVTLQNGLGNAEILADTFGADRVLKGTAHVPADLAPPNKVISHGFADLHVGGHVPAAQGLADPVAELFTRSGFKTIVSRNIDADVWEKLAFNAALNAMAMITESSNGAMAVESGRRIARAVVQEAVSVAGKIGLELESAQIEQTIAMALAHHPLHKASMLQDRECGRPTEIDNINGAIVRVGEKYGVATPVNATLADLVRIIESALPSSQPARSSHGKQS
jgi:2-dehydropantoate 2-reductase